MVSGQVKFDDFSWTSDTWGYELWSSHECEGDLITCWICCISYACEMNLNRLVWRHIFSGHSYITSFKWSLVHFRTNDLDQNAYSRVIQAKEYLRLGLYPCSILCWIITYSKSQMSHRLWLIIHDDIGLVNSWWSGPCEIVLYWSSVILFSFIM